MNNYKVLDRDWAKLRSNGGDVHVDVTSTTIRGMVDSTTS